MTFPALLSSQQTRNRFPRNRFLSALLCSTGMIALPALPAHAVDDLTTPVGEEVVGGSASFDRPHEGLLNIDQHTDRAVINWQRFDIGKNAKTEFFQPNAGSLAVNKVIGNHADPTQILGTLKANGQVMVLDRNGVFFGQNAVLDVGGIIASTGTVDNDAVMRGDAVLELSDFGDGSVINEGVIRVADAGLAAFVGKHVANRGLISAKLGKVALAAGEKVTVDLYGDNLVELAVDGKIGDALVENTGTIKAEGGRVTMTAQAAKDVVDNIINMEGVIDVSSVEVKGGKIILKGGGEGVVSVSGNLNASGGGDIDVSGENVLIEETATLSTDGVGTGSAGNVRIWGDRNTLFAGTVFARGGEQGGDGGFVEISAQDEVGYAGLVDTSAFNGAKGLLLIDPKNINIGTFDEATTLADLLADSLAGGTLGTLRVDSQHLANTLAFSDVQLWATTRINTVDTADLSTYMLPAPIIVGAGIGPAIVAPITGITSGTLTLSAKEVNIDHDIIMGTGGLNIYDILSGAPVAGGQIPPIADIEVDRVNLNAQILSRDTLGGPTSIIDRSKLDGHADKVNVLSDAALINQAIAFAATGGATVNVAAGTYNESVLADKDGLLIKGANAGLAGDDGGRGAESIIDPNSPGFHLDGVSGVTIDGFAIAATDLGVRIDGGSGNSVRNTVITGGTIGIQSKGSDTLVVRGNDISGQSGDGVLLKDSDDGRIVENTIHDLGDDAIHIDEGSDDAIIHDNTITDIDDTGVFVSGASTGASIFRVDVDGARHGVRIISASNDTLARDNTIAVTNNGIFVQDSTGVMLLDNTITGGMTGVMAEGSDTLSVIGNEISGQGPSGLGGLGDGVNVTDSDSATISENTISGVANDAISVATQSDDAVIEGNTISDVGDAGVVVSSSTSADIKDNDISDANHGVIVQNVSTGALVASNTISDITNDGVAIKGSDSAVVSGNTITDVGGDGVSVNPSDDILISGNTITGAGNDGIQVTGGENVTITENDVSGSTENGIDVNDNEGDVIITHNTTTSNGDDGIDIDGANHAEVMHNTSSANGDDGIDADDVGGFDSLLIGYNELTSNGDNGIEVDGAHHVEIFGNLSAGNDGDGINVSNVHGGLLLASVGATDDHEYESDAALFIYDNEVFSNEGNGVHLHGEITGGADIVDNNIQENGENGILIDTHSGLIICDGLCLTGGEEYDDGYDDDLGGVNPLNIIGNTIAHNDANGIRVGSPFFGPIWLDVPYIGGPFGHGFSPIRVIDNDINNNGRNGVQIEMVSLDLVSEIPYTVSTDGDGGDYDDYGHPSVLIADNRIVDNDENGVLLHGDTSGGADIINNGIRRNGANGVLITNTSGLLVGEVSIEGQNGDKDGKKHRDVAPIRIIENDIARNEQNGILIGAPELLLNQNDGHSYGYGGVPNPIRIVDNIIRGNGWNGVEIQMGFEEGLYLPPYTVSVDNGGDKGEKGGKGKKGRPDVLIKDNLIVNNGLNGVFLHGDTTGGATIAGNEILVNGANGILIGEPLFGFPTLLDNDFNISEDGPGGGKKGKKGGRDQGIKIVDNIIFRNGQNGVEIEMVELRLKGEQPAVLIKKNLISQNDGNGVFLHGDTSGGADIIENRIARNGANGVAIVGGSGAFPFPVGLNNEDDEYEGGDKDKDGKGKKKHRQNPIRIIDNTIVHNSHNGILIGSGRDIQAGSVGPQNGGGSLFDSGVHNPIKIIDNTINENGWNGIEIEMASKPHHKDGPKIDNIDEPEEYEGDGKDGKGKKGHPAVLIKNNRINHNGRNGVLLYGDTSRGADIVNNRIRYNYANGIKIGSPYRFYGQNGVNAQNGGGDYGDKSGKGKHRTQPIRIVDNTIAYNYQNGILVGNGNNNVRSRDIQGQGGGGYGRNKFTPIRIINNDIYENGWNGVEIKMGKVKGKSHGPAVLIKENWIHYNGQNGILIYGKTGGGIGIHSNDIQHNYANGIKIGGGYGEQWIPPYVTGQNDEYEGENGKKRHIKPIKITDNIINYNYQNGILIGNGSMQRGYPYNDSIGANNGGGYGGGYGQIRNPIKIIGNDINYNGWNGVEIEMTGMMRSQPYPVSISGDGEGGYAPYYDGPQVLIEENEIHENDWNGVYIHGNTAGGIDILGNDIWGNYANGVLIQGPPSFSSPYPYPYPFTSVAYDGEYGDYEYGPMIKPINITGNNISDNMRNGVLIGNGGMFLSDGPYDPYETSVQNISCEYGSCGGPIPFFEGGSVENPINIVDNTINGNGLNGAQVDRNFRSSFLSVNETDSEHPSLPLNILGNIFENNGSRGVFVSGPDHGEVYLTDNTFTDNPIGAEFESGWIDLTGEPGNQFFGGDVALRFAPFDLGLVSYPAVNNIGPNNAIFGYAPMALVDDTIGAQFFDGQSTFFVELDNQAFFDPGQPTLLSALDSTFVTPFGTITPSSTGGIITEDQFNFLESRFFHFIDDSTLGLFFFGVTPDIVTIAQEDIFNSFDLFDLGDNGFGVTINGLPFVSPGQLAEFLAGLNPNAGGEDGGGTTGEDLAGIEPAAGGSDSFSCLEDAAAGGGGTANIGGSDPEDLLNAATSCGASG